MTKRELQNAEAVLKFPRVVPPVKPLRPVGHAEFIHLYNNGDILFYSYGSDYTASIGLLLIERDSSKSGLKKIIEHLHKAPNALGMMQLYLRDHFEIGASAPPESILPPLDSFESRWALDDADYLYYMLATMPEQKNLLPVTITLKNGRGTGETLIVKWEKDQFFNVLADAHGRTRARASTVTPGNNVILNELSNR